MNQFEVWSCTVPFYNKATDKIVRKDRPVVILDGNVGVELGAETTGTMPRKWDEGDYRLLDWSQAGLKKPSTLRLNHLIVVTYLKKYRIGKLSNRDISNIINLIIRNQRYSVIKYNSRYFGIFDKTLNNGNGDFIKDNSSQDVSNTLNNNGNNYLLFTSRSNAVSWMNTNL